MQAHPDWVCLQLDFRNAFNTVSRSLIAAQLAEHHPGLLPYFYARYGMPTVLQVHTGPNQNAGLIYSTQGLHQGDPLAPFFFSLALRAAIIKLQAQIQAQIRIELNSDPNSPRAKLLHLLLAYLDDVTICGPPRVVAEVFDLLMVELGALDSGLVLNIPKCSLWSPCTNYSSDTLRDFFAHLPSNPLVDARALHIPTNDTGIVLLGAPIGSTPFCSDFLMAKAHALAAKLERVNAISSMQIKYLLLRFCAVPRVSYALRTAHPFASENMAIFHDETMLKAFQAFTETSSDHPVWRTLIQLPVNSNGAGISSAFLLSRYAYVASLADAFRNYETLPIEAVAADVRNWSTNLIPNPDLWEGSQMVNHVLLSTHAALSAHRQTQANHAFQERLVDQPALLPHNSAELLIADRKLQHRLSKLHHEITHSSLTGNVSEALRAYMLSSRQPGASYCLNIIPSSRELVISNEVFQHFISSHLLLPLLNNNGLSFCSCRDRFTANAPYPHIRQVPTSHAENCALGGGTVERHDALAQVAAEFLIASGFLVRKDFHKQGAGKQRPDLIVHDFPRPGDSSFIEVCVTNPLANQVVRAASTVPLSAASTREAFKIKKYTDLAREANFSIYTFVAESTGAFGKGIQQVLSLGAANADITAYTLDTITRSRFPPSFKKFWSQRLAVAFWQGSLQMQKARLRSITQPSLAPLSSNFPRHIARPYRNPSVPTSSSSYTPGAFFRS